MVWTQRNTLEAVELAIYLVCIFPTIYTAFQHRRHGKLAHFFLFAFVALRVVGNAMAINERNDTGGIGIIARIILNVGISSLIFATMYILVEARTYICDYANNRRKKISSICIEILIHLLIVIGIVLLAIGLDDAATETGKDARNALDMAKGGSILILVAWFTICIWNLFSLRDMGRMPPHRPAGILLIATTLALLFVGVRIIYLVVYIFHPSGDLNPQTGPFAVDLVLSTLMQLIAFLILLVALLFSKNIGRVRTTSDLPLSQKEVYGNPSFAS